MEVSEREIPLEDPSVTQKAPSEWKLIPITLSDSDESKVGSEITTTDIPKQGQAESFLDELNKTLAECDQKPCSPYHKESIPPVSTSVTHSKAEPKENASDGNITPLGLRNLINEKVELHTGTKESPKKVDISDNKDGKTISVSDSIDALLTFSSSETKNALNNTNISSLSQEEKILKEFFAEAVRNSIPIKEDSKETANGKLTTAPEGAGTSASTSDSKEKSSILDSEISLLLEGDATKKDVDDSILFEGDDDMKEYLKLRDELSTFSGTDYAKNLSKDKLDAASASSTKTNDEGDNAAPANDDKASALKSSTTLLGLSAPTSSVASPRAATSPTPAEEEVDFIILDEVDSPVVSSSTYVSTPNAIPTDAKEGDTKKVEEKASAPGGAPKTVETDKKAPVAATVPSVGLKSSDEIKKATSSNTWKDVEILGLEDLPENYLLTVDNETVRRAKQTWGFRSLPTPDINLTHHGFAKRHGRVTEANEDPLLNKKNRKRPREDDGETDENEQKDSKSADSTGSNSSDDTGGAAKRVKLNDGGVGLAGSGSLNMRATRSKKPKEAVLAEIDSSLKQTLMELEQEFNENKLKLQGEAQYELNIMEETHAKEAHRLKTGVVWELQRAGSFQNPGLIRQCEQYMTALSDRHRGEKMRLGIEYQRHLKELLEDLEENKKKVTEAINVQRDAFLKYGKTSGRLVAFKMRYCMCKNRVKSTVFLPEDVARAIACEDAIYEAFYKFEDNTVGPKRPNQYNPNNR